MVKQEGIPGRGESLIFDSPEEGRSFAERTAEKMQTRAGVVDRRRETVAEEVAKEFEKEGEGVEIIKHPWEHTGAEHEEVQQLVNLAFEKNLKTAIARARDSQYYPRNLDLLHDVLTTEMYQEVQRQRLNEQPVGVWVLAILSLLLLIIVVVVLLIAY